MQHEMEANEFGGYSVWSMHLGSGNKNINSALR